MCQWIGSSGNFEELDLIIRGNKVENGKWQPESGMCDIEGEALTRYRE